eukprot:CAMPEP_0196573908 /NCGR_PEP_ID=MMETSP1081-20130531/3724_1 /TAXON_ID=36882 /ORGANISM="Pyramimonas amylifera, Strain CCMP720" /LENGTH=265 /DNA_ID=CAMNT_0041891761 /DNA_START=420 /DNA_END=1217 /DNA_ORIENTATION=+
MKRSVLPQNSVTGQLHTLSPVELYLQVKYFEASAKLETLNQTYKALAMQGKLRQVAEQLGLILEEVMEIVRQMAKGKSGFSIPLVAASAAHNVALCYKLLGETNQVNALHKICLRYEEEVLGKDHLAVALRYTSMAAILSGQGGWEAARGMHKRASEVSEHCGYQRGHPHLATLLIYHAEICALTNQVALATSALENVEKMWLESSSFGVTPAEKAHMEIIKKFMHHNKHVNSDGYNEEIKRLWAPVTTLWCEKEILRQNGYWLI